MIKGICKVLSSIALICILYFIINATLLTKNEMVQGFYEQDENSVDVLMLGSSHMGINLDGAYMWDKYGIASYAMWAPSQPFWNTYFYLVEALKTQKPNVVVLDVYAATYDDGYQSVGEQTYNISSMKFSMNKINAINESVELKDRLAFIMGMPLYHDRYESLTKNDFSYILKNDENCFKGYENVTAGSIGDYNMDEADDLSYVQNIAKKQEKYLVKIIKLCKDKNLNLLLIKTPSVKRSWEQGYYNRVKEIAEEYDVDFIDYNQLDDVINLDNNDIAKDGIHINKNGARKIAKHLGQILVERYGVTDRRGDAHYDSWSKWSEEDYNKELHDLNNNELYFEQLKRKKHDVIVIKTGKVDNDVYFEGVCKLIQGAGIKLNELSQTDYGSWQFNTEDMNMQSFLLGDEYSNFIVNNNEFEVYYEKPATVKMNGADIYKATSPGVIMLVCDDGSIIDKVAFCRDKNYQLVHF